MNHAECIPFFKFYRSLVGLEEREEHKKEDQENLQPHYQQLTEAKTETVLKLTLYYNKGLEVHLFQMLDSINMVEHSLSLKQVPKLDDINSHWSY